MTQVSTRLGRNVAIAAMLSACATQAQQAPAPGEAERHAAAGRAAAADFPGLGGLCDLQMQFRDVNDASARAARGPRPTRADGAVRPGSGRPGGATTGVGREQPAPMKIFDNLYFLGTSGVSAWLLGTPEGYILIDALNTDAEAKTYIEGGMRTLGLDASAIKLLLVTHAHGDHFGGSRYLVETYKVPVAMSEADWALAATLPPHPRFGSPPARDVTVTDGQTLTVGKTRLTVRITPGHTPGTISPIFTVYDHATPHRAALWGGTGFNFGSDPKDFDLYAQSATAYRRTAGAAGVDVFLSNHPARDGALEKMRALAARRPGDPNPNPFVMGDRALGAFTVLGECAAAQAARLKAAQ